MGFTFHIELPMLRQEFMQELGSLALAGEYRTAHIGCFCLQLR